MAYLELLTALWISVSWLTVMQALALANGGSQLYYKSLPPAIMLWFSVLIGGSWDFCKNKVQLWLLSLVPCYLFLSFGHCYYLPSATFWLQTHTNSFLCNFQELDMFVPAGELLYLWASTISPPLPSVHAIHSCHDKVLRSNFIIPSQYLLSLFISFSLVLYCFK